MIEKTGYVFVDSNGEDKCTIHENRAGGIIYSDRAKAIRDNVDKIFAEEYFIHLEWDADLVSLMPFFDEFLNITGKMAVIWVLDEDYLMALELMPKTNRICVYSYCGLEDKLSKKEILKSYFNLKS
jgi:hypothetical protein